MSKQHCLTILATVIGVLIILPSAQVDAQSTVDDSTLCESSTLDDAVSIIREDLKDVELIRVDLQDVKNLLESNQQQSNATCISKKEMEDLKATFASDQQQNNASSSLHEVVSLIREDLKDVKNLLGSIQQQLNATG